jgi:DNA-binding Lrp family transcriptional regulator
MTLNIDLKDKQVLYFLDRNSRQSFSDIAKKTNIAKASLVYRVNRMEEKGIIKNYYTVINPFKLGFIPFRFYLRFQYADPAMEQQIINHFAADPRAWWVASLKGKYSLTINMLIKHNHEFLEFWKETLDQYRYYIQEEVFSIYFQLCARNYSYLNPEVGLRDVQQYIIDAETQKITLTENEAALLKLISNSARMPGTEIAQRLGISSPGVSYLFKQLEKHGVILGYRVNIDIKKLGYEDFKLDLFLTDYKKRDEVISFIQQDPHLVLLSKSVGISDVEAEFHFEDVTMLHATIDRLLERFPGIIRSHSYHHVAAQHKWNFVPLI